ncbi:MAG: hypothetical protein ACOCXH_04450 [Cyclobacteriaceae bacterium]
MLNRFDPENMNAENYYDIDLGDPNYVIIYPFILRDVRMMTENQYKLLKYYGDIKETAWLFRPDLMWQYVTFDLADKVIQILRKGEDVRFQFSRQEAQDVLKAVERFNEKYKKSKETLA